MVYSIKQSMISEDILRKNFFRAQAFAGFPVLKTGIRLLPILFISGLLACNPGRPTEPTVVYLVRHAEKDLTDLSAQDPPLTEEGYRRAGHLAERLQNEKVEVILSTRYQRNRNTVQPLAEAKRLRIEEYDWHDHEGVRKLLTGKHAGKTVVFCGHGDNMLPLIALLVAEPPLDSIPAYEYDNLFTVVIQPDGSATARVEKFN
jgi:2,3-bisphosphoglycerate-dependent phosphoglycerate mutase